MNEQTKFEMRYQPGRPTRLEAVGVTIEVVLDPLDGGPPTVKIDTGGSSFYKPSDWQVIVNGATVQAGQTRETSAYEY